MGNGEVCLAMFGSAQQVIAGVVCQHRTASRTASVYLDSNTAMAPSGHCQSKRASLAVVPGV